ncbi:TIGR03364 family FAD-dependent oxidoreductase [Protaetiibacter larvae]|uniref:TIGR03364 family FAD-dependent oxidoreductase n=1 Tax=Protaetiibacter larvae TaxID=2592654 RepID=A0A5C1Y5S7_9MICO|nr:TIGR03364 family FAD-dependent oxidoreductase [Protaetiibacter larvae]QEO09141.1 TIGR03364 family FAD-dependent oxidoreductase [Protaetiibacter larvae]
MDRFDLAVVGAGIVGLGHAAAAVERGLSVVVVDRATAITGSTVRNFGHIGTGVQAGRALEYAERAREVWLRLAERAGFWVREAGTLVVARHEDELALLEESGIGELLTASQVAERAPVVGALGGMLRPRDLQVDPREAGPAIARHLAERGVEFRWRTTAFGAETGVLHTSRGDIRAEAIVVAVNVDVDQLYPEIAEEHAVVRCGLDMLLTDGVGLGLPLLTGSSLLRYSAFAGTPSAAAVRARFAAEEPELLERDVNQMYTERPDGTLVVGDTHYRGTAVPPFQDERAFALLERLGAEIFGRELRVRERWQGVYASAPEDFLRVAPADGVRVVAVTTGIGMTTGLGLGDSVITELWGAS